MLSIQMHVCDFVDVWSRRQNRYLNPAFPQTADFSQTVDLTYVRNVHNVVENPAQPVEMLHLNIGFAPGKHFIIPAGPQTSFKSCTALWRYNRRLETKFKKKKIFRLLSLLSPVFGLKFRLSSLNVVTFNPWPLSPWGRFHIKIFFHIFQKINCEKCPSGQPLPVTHTPARLRQEESGLVGVCEVTTVG